MKSSKFMQFYDGKVEGIIFSNSIVPLYMNQLLMPMTEKRTSNCKRILFVSSTIHDPELPIIPGKERTDIPKSVQFGDFDAFALTERYPKISVIAFCPGFVPTTQLSRNKSGEVIHFIRNIATKFVPVVTEEESASEYIYYATNPEISHSNGKYFRYTKVAEPSKDVVNREKREAYWVFANEMIDINLKQIQ